MEIVPPLRVKHAGTAVILDFFNPRNNLIETFYVLSNKYVAFDVDNEFYSFPFPSGISTIIDL